MWKKVTHKANKIFSWIIAIHLSLFVCVCVRVSVSPYTKTLIYAAETASLNNLRLYQYQQCLICCNFRFKCIGCALRQALSGTHNEPYRNHKAWSFFNASFLYWLKVIRELDKISLLVVGINLRHETKKQLVSTRNVNELQPNRVNIVLCVWVLILYRKYFFLLRDIYTITEQNSYITSLISRFLWAEDNFWIPTFKWLTVENIINTKIIPNN
jgi:hypothetical protein